MPDNKRLPSHQVSLEQQLALLAIVAKISGYDAAQAAKVTDIFRRAEFKQSGIENSKVMYVMNFFVDLGVAFEEGMQYRLSPELVAWAQARAQGDDTAARQAMQQALHSTWLGLLASNHGSDMGQLRDEIKRAGHMTIAADDPEARKSALDIAMQFVQQFGLADVTAAIPEPAPMPRTEPEPETISEPAPRRDEAPPRMPPASPQPVAEAGPIFAQSEEPGSATTVSVSVDENTIRVRVNLDIQLPISNAEARLEKLLQALIGQIAVQLPEESDQ